MTADKVQWLYINELDNVLARAKVEGWTELALLGQQPFLARMYSQQLVRKGWDASRVFVLTQPLGHVPSTLASLSALTSLDLGFNQIGDAAATDITQLENLTSLHLGHNRVGDKGATAIASLTGLTSLDLSYNQIGDGGTAAIASLTGLTSLDLGHNQIGDTAATAIARLAGLTSLNLRNNQIGDVGARAIARIVGLTSLNLAGNLIGDAGATAIASLTGLSSLHVGDNQIGDAGATAISRLVGLTSLDLRRNQIGDAGATAIAGLTGLTSLFLANNQIGDTGARALLDAWADPATSEQRLFLDLSNNGGHSELLPAEVLNEIDAQASIAAWRGVMEAELPIGRLPEPGAVGQTAKHGVQIGMAAGARLTIVDPSILDAAQDDMIARELHSEVLLALDRLIAAAGRSNAVAEWREVAEAAKARLGSGPQEVRVSAILRIERLRSLREADDRRRLEPDPLVEPAEAGVAAALRDAVAAANLYIETDPYLAEQQRRLSDPDLELAISTEEAEAAEVEMAALDISDPALLAELRLGRETAEAGGRAGARALAWLAGSWRNVVREMLRQVLAWVREQVKAARASAGEAAMQAKLGAAITIDEAVEVLASLGLQGGRAASGAFRAGGESAGRIWRHGEPVLGKAGAGVFMLWLADNVGLLTRLGWSPEFAAQIQRLLAGIAG